MSSTSGRERLGEILRRRGLITDQQLAAALAEQHGLGVVGADELVADPALASRVPAAVARRHGLLPLGLTATGLVRLAVADPAEREGPAAVAEALQAALTVVVGPEEALRAAVARTFPPAAAPTEEEVLEELQVDELLEELAAEEDDDDDEKIVAISARIEPGAGSLPPLPVQTAPHPPAPTSTLPPLRAAARPAAPAPPPLRFPEGPLVLGLDEPAAQGLASLAAELRSSRTADGLLRLLGGVVAHGIQVRSDALRLRPHADWMQVEYRIDGLWELGGRLPAWARSGLVRALWAVVGLQEGAPAAAARGRLFEAEFAGRRIPVRVEVVGDGEVPAVLLRPADPAAARALHELDLPDETYRRVRQWTAAREGLVLVVGPEGSGRTTTLAAIADALGAGRPTAVVGDWDFPVPARASLHRWSEGPQPAVALRAAMAADPLVLVVDGLERAPGLVLRASVEGFLVVASVSGEDFADAAERLLTAGLHEDLLGGQILGVVEQRLVPRLCAECRQRAPLDRTLVRELGLLGESLPSMLYRRGAGCRACRHSGVHGRSGIFSRVEPRSGVPRGLRGAELRRRMDSFRPRRPAQEGLRLALEGQTSLEELAAALGVGAPPRGPIVSLSSADVAASTGAVTVAGDGPLLADQDLAALAETTDVGLGLRDAGTTTVEGPAPGEPDAVLLLATDTAAAERAEQVLPSARYRLVRAADLSAVREFVRRRAPAAVLISGALPPDQLGAALGALRGDLASAFLPLLVLDAPSGVGAELMRAGADAVFERGSSATELGARLQAVLERAG